jgi:hypothetical protein
MRKFASYFLAASLFLGMPMLAAASGEKHSPKPPVKGASKGAQPTAGNARSTSAAGAEAPKPAPAPIEAELQQLREMLQAQAQQLVAQSAALREQQRKMEALENQLKTANAPRENVSAAVGNPENSGKSIGLVANAASTAATASTGPQQGKESADSPLAIRFKGITITPGGFMAAEAVWRQRALSADVNTPFNSIPFPGSSQSKLTEFNASGRPSRITMLAEGKLSRAKLSGYYEADFLSSGTTSNNNQSNSYTFRQRQFWGQAALDSGWSFTGGQMWSLVTETRKGVQNRTEAVPLTIDHQYHAGFSWARQFGFRVSKSLQDKVWLALSVEGAQTTFAGHGLPSNFLIGTAGAGGGAFNSGANYSFNAAPDFIVKAVFEPGLGHYEIFGLVSVFRSRVFPAAPATPFNDSRVGGGIGANARVPLFNKKLDVGLHVLGGDGINRYGTTGLPDATVRTDGTLALIRGGQALGTLEWHTTPMVDVYFNVGGDYAARAAYLNAARTAGVGYGSPLFNNSGCSTEPAPGSGGFAPGTVANCTGDTRDIIEGTLGFWHRFYKGDRGTLQWGAQYSHVVRNTWSGVGGAPHGVENMIFTSFRYYLP